MAVCINDKRPKTCSSDEIKFVDDLQVFETGTKSYSSKIQHAVSEIEEWSESNKCGWTLRELNYLSNRIKSIKLCGL